MCACVHVCACEYMRLCVHVHACSCACVCCEKEGVQASVNRRRQAVN